MSLTIYRNFVSIVGDSEHALEENDWRLEKTDVPETPNVWAGPRETVHCIGAYG